MITITPPQVEAALRYWRRNAFGEAERTAAIDALEQLLIRMLRSRIPLAPGQLSAAERDAICVLYPELTRTQTREND